MKILILGTSNSVMRNGWVDGLKSVLGNIVEITNLSLGASPGLQFAIYMNMDFSIYDYVFFDSLPNDEEYFYGVGPKIHPINYNIDCVEFYNKIYYEILSTISSQTNLIVIAIPLFLNLETPSYMYLTREQLARHVGGQFLDFRAIIDNLHSVTKSNVGILYEALQHPTIYIANYIGTKVGEVLQDVELRNSLKFFHENKNYKESFITRDLTQEYSDEQLYQLSNSLVSTRFALLKGSSHISISSDSYLIGFYINQHMTQTHLNLINRDDVVGRISLISKFENGLLLKVFIPSPVTSYIDRIELSPSGTLSNCLPIPYKDPAMLSTTITEPSLSISQMCFWKPSGDKISENLNLYVYEHKRITDLICRSIRNDYYIFNSSQSESGLKSMHGYSIYYDVEQCKCIAIDDCLTSLHPNVNLLLPVRIKMLDDGRGCFIVSYEGVDICLSLFSQGIGLPASHPFRGRAAHNMNLGSYLGDSFILAVHYHQEKIYLTFKVGETYLRCYMVNYQNILQFNATNVSTWEMFYSNKLG